MLVSTRFLTISQNFASNYGFAGVAAKYTLIADEASGFSASARGSYAMLLGVEDYNMYQGAADIMVGYDLWLFTPYVGAAVVYTTASETTDKVDFDAVHTVALQGTVGTQFTWKFVSVAAETTIAKLPIYSHKVGATF